MVALCDFRVRDLCRSLNYHKLTFTAAQPDKTFLSFFFISIVECYLE